MTIVTFVSPILPGKQEAWRRFIQEMLEVYRSEYEDFRKRMGITRVLAWLIQMPQGNTVIIHIESDDLCAIIPKLTASDLPFDRRFLRQVLELHGLDLSRPSPLVTELVLDC